MLVPLLRFAILNGLWVVFEDIDKAPSDTEKNQSSAKNGINITGPEIAKSYARRQLNSTPSTPKSAAGGPVASQKVKCRSNSRTTFGFTDVEPWQSRLQREVAVKQLKIGGSQGECGFRAEVEIISRVHHRHLVSLVGYCTSYHQRLLVYQYVPNNTLHYHLDCEGRPVMDWATRIRFAAGAARGMAYLHEDCKF
ncbi:putative protein kinase RLK-Pelle-PERK-1 family [Helianthus anomalus]